LSTAGPWKSLASENRDGFTHKEPPSLGAFTSYSRRATDLVRRFLSMHDFCGMAPANMAPYYRTLSSHWLEIGVSVASNSPPSERLPVQPINFIADVASVAKKDLKPGEILDVRGWIFCVGPPGQG